MEITSDVMLRGTAWNAAIEGLSSIFTTRTNYSLFMLTASIGIMYDRRIDKPEENGEDPHSVPRNVLQNNDNGKLDLMFQAAVLTTKTIDITEEKRLEFAFGDKEQDYNQYGFSSKINLITEFSNYGVTELIKNVGNTDIETIDKLKNFLEASVEGRNLDIDALPDEILLEDV